MPEFVTPKVYLIGYTDIHEGGLLQYLRETGNDAFEQDIEVAQKAGLTAGEILCSTYSKICYASLSEGKNANITRTRAIADNLKATLKAAHGSVFEHFQLNFIVTDCSRVYTHEQVRHRPGFAYSQTSGRYVRGDTIKFITDPILDPVKMQGMNLLHDIEEAYGDMCDAMGLNGKEGVGRYITKQAHDTDDPEWRAYCGVLPRATIEGITLYCERYLDAVDPDKVSFDYKKKVTSALRRFLPNGQANEMGFSCNIRSLRQVIQLRTSRHAEWEIRTIYAQVYRIVSEKYPLLFHDANAAIVDGLPEVTGMKMQPYEQTPE